MLAKILAKSIRSLFILLQALQHACMNNVLPGKTASQHDHQEAGKENHDEEDHDLKNLTSENVVFGSEKH